ncbi:MAG: flippase-like domain-containing protein [Crocinitomicaceae bacterium]|nr:flippase-like domain-containing protein [Crocinitomicaceae bacterium]
MQQPEERQLKKQLSWKRILVPVVLGLAAASWILVHNLNTFSYIEATPADTGWHYKYVDGNGNRIIDRTDDNDFEFTTETTNTFVKKTSIEQLKSIHWDNYASLALIGALLMVALRDFGYVYRIRSMTDKQLSWKQSFEVIMLWEFASAMTPSVVGGSGIAMFIINREGINMGKSTAITFVTAMLDELFYILTVPLIFLLIGSALLFPDSWVNSSFGTNSVKILFYIGYGFIVFLTLLIILGIFVFPVLFKRLLQQITSVGFLKKFRKRATRVGDEIMTCSSELRGKKISYWSRAFIATIISWTARFFTLNFILLIFTRDFDHLLVYGRQLIMWVIMLISPTPGGSGIAELALANFFNYILPAGLLAIVALIWRLLTYFPYLFLGAIILPRFLKRTASPVQIETNKR